MDNRKIQLLLVTLLLTPGSVVVAQSTGANVTEDERVAEARAMLQAGRDEIIAEEMALSADETGRFWPVYEAYRGDMKVARDRYAKMLGRYLTLYEAGDVTDEYARELLDEMLEYAQARNKVRKDYVRKFEKVLPIRGVVRFYQLEDNIDAEIDAELALVIPLMEAF